MADCKSTNVNVGEYRLLLNTIADATGSGIKTVDKIGRRHDEYISRYITTAEAHAIMRAVGDEMDCFEYQTLKDLVRTYHRTHAGYTTYVYFVQQRDCHHFHSIPKTGKSYYNENISKEAYDLITQYIDLYEAGGGKSCPEE